MNSLATRRVEELHQQLLAAGERYLHLRFLAMRPREGKTFDWPIVHADRGDCLGLPDCDWKDLFALLGYKYGKLFAPLRTIWLRIDGQLWQGAYYYGGTTAAADKPATKRGQPVTENGEQINKLQAQHRRLLKGIGVVVRLAELLIVDAPLLPTPALGTDERFCEQNTARDWQWLEVVCQTGTFHDALELPYRVRDLGNVFSASAVALERLHPGDEASAGPTDAANVPSEVERRLREILPDGQIVFPTHGGGRHSVPAWEPWQLKLIEKRLVGELGEKEAAETLKLAGKLLIMGVVTDAVLQHEQGKRQAAAGGSDGADRPASGTPAKPVKLKRSTERGDADAVLCSTLTKHHKFKDESCLNPAPIGCRDLARKAGLGDKAGASASRFFKNHFGGHGKYKVICRDNGKLIASLKLLNRELEPRDAFGGAADHLQRAEKTNRDDE